MRWPWTLVSPGIMHIHQRVTWSGVLLVRAFSEYDPFAQNPVTWFEMLANAGIYCLAGAALAVVMQTRKKWRNTFRLIIAVAFGVVLAAWLIPHNFVKPYGEEGEGIVLTGEGTMIIAFTEELGHAQKPNRDSRFVERKPFPGVIYSRRVGLDLRGDLLNMGDLLSKPDNEQPKVIEHRYIVDMWVFLLPFLLYPMCALYIREHRRGKRVICADCGDNLTRWDGATCPGCDSVVPQSTGQ